MKPNNFNEIRERFFVSYKSFVDCLMLTHNEYNGDGMYSILVLKKKGRDGLSRISISIRNTHSNRGMLNEFSNNAILPDVMATQLIEDIREDFKENHVISYSIVNPRDHIQTLQNTKFSLNIVLNTEQELEEAMNFNSRINGNSGRYRVLTKD